MLLRIDGRIDGRMDTSLMVGDFRAWLGKELVATILAARKNYARQLGQTTRWLSIESGSMTASPYRYSQNRNATSVPADPQNSPMTFALLYLYVVPPHSMARRNMIAVEVKIVKPRMSREWRIEGSRF
jgi:hypothetical protein